MDKLKTAIFIMATKAFRNGETIPLEIPLERGSLSYELHPISKYSSMVRVRASSGGAPRYFEVKITEKL